MVAAALPRVASAQLLHPSGGAAPSFEVASVRPNPNTGQAFSFILQPTRFVAQNAPLDRLIRFAYNVKSSRQLVNMPDWAGSRGFDIDAKIGDAEVDAMKSLTPDQRFAQYRLMVQSLLADRFQMKVSTETRELPVYALVLAKGGPRLTPAVPQDLERQRFPRLGFTAAGDLTARSVSMSFFADWLSGRLDTADRVVIDATGLKGTYDFALQWNPVGGAVVTAGANPPPVSAPQPNEDKPSLFTAIQEQLGLKLESQKAPVEVLVIESVEQPTEN